MGPRYSDVVVSYIEPSLVPTLLGYDPLLQFVHEEDCLRVFEQATLGSHPGVFNVVGMMKIRKVHKPAVKARRGTNPFTGEEMMFKAKPSRNVVKVTALKALKDMV